MINNKYTPIESLNRIQLMMNYNLNKTLTENSNINTNNISITNNDYLFDFVISEESGFVIYMDNVFSKTHGFIGNLWENTWVFNQIIRENIYKYYNILGENVEKEIDSILMSITWTKELVAESLLNKENLHEFDLERAKKALGNMGKTITSGISKAGNFAQKLLTGPILDTMRWIRRNAYTDIGMVIDILTSMLPATTGINKIAWFMVIILDMYEIIKGDIDPKDTDRKADPFLFLIQDLIAALFTVAGGIGFRSAIRGFSAGKKMPSVTVNLLKSLLEKLPTVKNMIRSVGSFLTKHLPSIKSIVDFVLQSINWVLRGVENFVKELLSKKGIAAGATSAAIAYLFYTPPIKFGSVGEDVKALNDYLLLFNSYGFECNEIDGKTIEGIKKSGNKFTKATESGVKVVEACFVNHEVFSEIFKDVDGVVSEGESAAYLKVILNDRNLVTKWIPHKTKKDILENMSLAVEYLKEKSKNILNPVTHPSLKKK